MRQSNLGIPQLKMIAFMFILSPLLYMGIVWFMKSSGNFDTENPNLGVMTMAFAAVYASQVGLAFFFPMLRMRSRADGDPISLYRSVVIVQLGLLESGAVFGLVLGFLGADLMVTAAFCLASIFFLTTVFPSEQKLRRMTRR